MAGPRRGDRPRGVGPRARAAQAYKALGIVALDRGRLTEALGHNLAALELDPDYDEALYNAASIAYELGRWDLALEPQSRDRGPVGQMGLLEYLHELGFDDAARQLERRLGDQRPLSDYAQLYLAERALRLGRHGAARERLATLRGAYPDWSRVWRVSGEVEVWAGDLAAAVPYLESAIERSPDPDPRGRVRLAWLLEQQGRGDEAAAILAPLERQQRAAIDAGSESWGHPWALAAAALARGDRAAALDELERAYDTGLRQHLLLSTDPMLEPLRSEPRFADLIERMRADVERMRRRAAPVVAGLALPR